MAASVWSGYLTFGLISMPVRLFSGARSSGISFHMLHRDDQINALATAGKLTETTTKTIINAPVINVG